MSGLRLTLDVNPADGAPGESWRINAAGDAVENFTPGGGTQFRRDDLTAAGGEDTITLAETPVDGSLEVYLAPSGSGTAGLLLSTAYSGSGTTYTLTTAASAGDVYVVRYATEAAAPGASTLTAPAPTGYSATILADSPLAYWRMGDTGPYGTRTATASSNFSTEPPANAIDGNATTYWTTNGIATGWLRIQFANAGAATSYSIRRRDDLPNRNPKDWTFEGSNDGTTWTTLDTQTGVTWPTAGETKAFTFANATSYSYYRLNVSANNGDTYLSVAELVVGKVADSSGNGRDLPLVGVTPGAPGLLVGDADTAMTFSSAATGPVTPANPTYFNVSTLSLEAWIKTTTAALQSILDRDNESSRQFQLRVESTGLVRLIAFSGASSVQITSASAYNDGNPHHVVATINGTALLLYVDGTQVASGTLPGAFNTSTSNFAIGYHLGNGGTRFVGTIDEVAVYGTVLSLAQVQAHHSAGI